MKTLLSFLILINFMFLSSIESNFENMSFGFKLQDYFFRYDEQGKISESYQTYQACADVTSSEIDFYRNEINSVSPNISESELKIAKSKVKCSFLNPLNNLIWFILIMVFLHFLIISILDLTKIENKVQMGEITYKQFIKKKVITLFIYLGLITGAFSIFVYPIEVFYDLLFNNSAVILKQLFWDFINILKGV